MELRVFQVDAFIDSVFGGNSAAVCPLKADCPMSYAEGSHGECRR